MAYFDSSGGFNVFTTGERVPFVPPSAIYCDPCAEEAIPLPEKTGVRDSQRHFGTPFKWTPHYGAPCSGCGKPT